MTLADFAGIVGLLAVQLRATDVDEATIRGYYEALKDLDVELVAMAAQRIGQGATVTEHGVAWFPKAPEWRALVGKIEGDRTDALRAVLRKLPTPLCLACDDTGWTQATGNHGTAIRWKHCACRTLRRLEVLGRRPMPTVPERLEA